MDSEADCAGGAPAHTVAERRESISWLLDLAAAYRGVSRSALSGLLGREPRNLMSGAGSPRLDSIMSLAEALDWDAGDVIDVIWNSAAGDVEAAAGKTASELNAEALELLQNAKFGEALRKAELAVRLATTPEERGRAYMRQCGAYDGQGRYTRARDAARKGLIACPFHCAVRTALLTNLGVFHYILGDCDEAYGVALSVLSNKLNDRLEPLAANHAKAFAHYVKGQALRVKSSDVQRRFGQPADEIAEEAVIDLGRAIVHFERSEREFGWRGASGVAWTCRGALIELQVLLGNLRPDEGISMILDRLEGAKVQEAELSADDLESIGWWCIYGSNIALDALRGDEQDRVIAIFSNKALEIAERLENWALTERVVFVDFTRQERALELENADGGVGLDTEDVRSIVGAMGRFPGLRAAGLRLLRRGRRAGAE